MDFLQSKTGKELDPFELSLAHGSFLFTWPSTDSCSEAEHLGCDRKMWSNPCPMPWKRGTKWVGWTHLCCSISGAFCDCEVLKSSVWSVCCETYVSLLDTLCIVNLMLYEIGSKFCLIWIGPRSGFTDFQSLTFYNATFSNPGQCGDLLAETVDLDAVLRFPSEGDGPANPGGLG